MAGEATRIFVAPATKEEAMIDVLTLPGIGGSGDAHWQTLWERADPSMRRFRPTSWDAPELADWCRALDEAVAAARTPPLLVAHSLACLLVAHWQTMSSLPVAGAFLVAVPDPESPSFPREAADFADPPSDRLRFPSLIVASTDDPYGSLDYAHRRAAQWGAGIVEAGPLGHINGASGLDDWPQGRALRTAFAAALGSQPTRS
jgi:predicted alpha/beta hydrolase family esterase